MLGGGEAFVAYIPVFTGFTEENNEDLTAVARSEILTRDFWYTKQKRYGVKYYCKYFQCPVSRHILSHLMVPKHPMSCQSPLTVSSEGSRRPTVLSVATYCLVRWIHNTQCPVSRHLLSHLKVLEDSALSVATYCII